VWASGFARVSGFALAGALVLGSVGMACARQDAEPVTVAKRFAESARRGDVEAMMAVLERPAVARLERAAERASDQVGGRRSIAAAEMLQIVGVDRSISITEATLVDQSEQLAHVDLGTTAGQTIRIELVWEPAEDPAEGEPQEDASEGSWKVRIPLPSLPPTSTSTALATPDA